MAAKFQSVPLRFFPGAELWNASFHSRLPTYKEDHGPLAQQGPLRQPHFCESRCSHAQGFLAVRPSILRVSKGHRRQDVEHETTHKLHKAAFYHKGMIWHFRLNEAFQKKKRVQVWGSRARHWEILNTISLAIWNLRLVRGKEMVQQSVIGFNIDFNRHGTFVCMYLVCICPCVVCLCV